jgi:ATP-dependent DNA ligase
MYMRALPAGFVPPCLPTKAQEPPSGPTWLHEIKHDGFRVIARKDGSRVRLYSRPGNDLTDRFRLIVEALVWLRAGSCIIDGEAVCCGDDGMPSFDHIRYRRHDGEVFLYAFDLIELNGDDLRREPFDTRKATLASLLRRAAPGLRLNEHIEADGPTGVRPCLQDGPRGYRIEAEGLALSQRPLARLAQIKESSVRGGEARGRGGLGQTEMAINRLSVSLTWVS